MKNVIAAAIALTTAAGLANAGVVFSGTGNNPEVNANASGTADFSLSGDILTVVLTNTTSPRTAAQGNALTGVTFDVTGANPGLDLTSTALGGSLLWTSKTASTSSANINGSWTDVLGASPLGEFGAASTGFAGRFNGGSISLGNASPNYGVVAAGTFDGTNVAFGGSQFPFIQGSVTLTFSGATGMDLAKLANVQILFGTDGTGNITTTKVPAPGSLALLAMAGAVAGRRRR
ncbi:MAG TPA: XDD4 family exosortase-dependent surface protein [Phycisphaerales bacterium]|nr:XDD4 family exosortase-dependent surface protein [Phycisphaerales bacterium]